MTQLSTKILWLFVATFVGGKIKCNHRKIK